MPLPKIATPSYELELPSTGKTIQYRPFLVKEEKLLVIALESEDTKQITNAIKTILKSCIQTRGIKVEELPTFDIEYIFLNIRGKSVGESIDVLVTCPDDGKTQVEHKVYIDEIQVKKDEKHNRDIKLDHSLTLRMKYPSLNEFIQSNFSVTETNTLEASMDIISSCIDVVYSEDESWAAADCTKKELDDWLETLNTSQFKEIETFFETMPKLTHVVKVTNPNTKVESEVTMEGLTSFFG